MLISYLAIDIIQMSATTYTNASYEGRICRNVISHVGSLDVFKCQVNHYLRNLLTLKPRMCC